jgi:hypothetical protein
MNKNLLILFIGFLSISLSSQISITSANMPISGDTARYTAANLNSIGNYTTTGFNHVWDFSTLDSIGQGIREFLPSTSTPYFFYFLSPKYGEKTVDSIPIPAIPLAGTTISIKDIYSFYKKNGALSFNSEGLGLTLSGIPIGTTATGSNDDELYMFPLNYADRDSTTFSFSTPTFSSIPFTYKKHGYRITEADGWGTITTPYGTEACLRVVTTQYSIDTIKINALSAPLNKIGFPNYARSYQWLTLTEKIPYLEISGNVIGGNFTPTQAKYRDVIRSFVGIKEEQNTIALSVFPNPTNNEVNIIIAQNDKDVVAEITDLQGKVILTKILNQNAQIINQHNIDVSSIAKGTYFLNLRTSNSKQTLKISVQ